MLTFTLTEAGQTRTLKLPQDEIIIGRARGNAVVVRNIKASRKHARIERTGGIYQVTDLDSGNGTKVNGEKISFHTLDKGDEIRIGDAVLVLKSIDDAVEMDAGNAADETDMNLKLPPIDNAETEVEVKSVPQKLAAKPAAKAAPAPAKPAIKLELKKPAAAAPAAKPGLGLRFKK